MALNFDQLNRLFNDNSASVLPHVPRGVHANRPYPDSRIMAGIALAESSGDPNVINSIGATGLWQILWSAWKGDSYIHLLTGGSQHKLLDPVTNARAACYIYYVGTRRGYSPDNGYASWDTYNSGAYKKNVPGTINTLPVPESVAAKGVDGAVATATAVESVGGWVGTLTETLRKITLNAGGLLVGIVLLILGVIILSRSELGTAVKTVAKVA